MEIFQEANWYISSFWNGIFELREGEKVWAVIHRKIGFSKLKAIIEFQQHRMELHRPTIWDNVWRLNEDGEKIATLQRNSFRSFQLSIQNSNRYIFAADNLLGTRRKWLTSNGDNVMEVYRHWAELSFLKRQTISVKHTSVDPYDILLLSCVGFFMLDHLRRRRAGS